MDKSPDAFRTISEVAEDLDVPQHVLRFWETRFAQIKPLKRGGGRRYYRPDDVDLLRGIRRLLYGEGYTIRGVQRILKVEGARHVQAIGRGEITADPARSDADEEAEIPAEDAIPVPAGVILDEHAPAPVGHAHASQISAAHVGAAHVGAAHVGAAHAGGSHAGGSHAEPAPYAQARPGGSSLAAAEIAELRAILDDLEECRRLLDRLDSDDGAG